MLKKRILLFLFSLSFLPIWMAFLLGQNSHLVLFGGFVYSFISPFIVRWIYNKDFDKKEYKIISIGPIFYLLMYFYAQGVVQHTWRFIDLISPFFMGLYFFIIGVFTIRTVVDLKKIFFFIFASLFYFKIILPIYMDSESIAIITNFDETSNDKTKEIKSDVNLADFQFINVDKDTTVFSNNDKYILFETWNEGCIPCMRAFKEMPEFYASIKTQVDVFYLYEHHKESVRNEFEKIFNFRAIEDSSRILIDINQNLFNTMNMTGYPYFLLFDKKGNLKFWQCGFDLNEKEKLKAEIIATIK